MDARSLDKSFDATQTIAPGASRMILTTEARYGLVSVWLFMFSVATACDDDEAADRDGHEDAEHSESTHDTHAAGSGAGDEHSDDHEAKIVGPLTGATCPNGSTLTYENFAKQFFSSYCLSCHSERVVGAARMNAPGDHNFDTLAEIELLAGHIDQLAGSGPAATNVKMPPRGATPTDEERKMLSAWIACDHPE
jgi:hypothetical protein